MKYELTVIVPGDRDKQAALAADEQVKKVIVAAGATMTNERPWGRRDLAYPIDKQLSGYYTTFELEADGGAILEMERALRLSTDVIRFLFVRAFSRPSPLVDRPLPEGQGRTAEEALRRSSTPAAKQPSIKKDNAKVAPKKTASKKARQKELDAALSKILEEN